MNEKSKNPALEAPLESVQTDNNGSGDSSGKRDRRFKKHLALVSAGAVGSTLAAIFYMHATGGKALNQDWAQNSYEALNHWRSEYRRHHPEQSYNPPPFPVQRTSEKTFNSAAPARIHAKTSPPLCVWKNRFDSLAPRIIAPCPPQNK